MAGGSGIRQATAESIRLCKILHLIQLIVELYNWPYFSEMRLASLLSISVCDNDVWLVVCGRACDFPTCYTLHVWPNWIKILMSLVSTVTLACSQRGEPLLLGSTPGTTVASRLIHAFRLSVPLNWSHQDTHAMSSESGSEENECKMKAWILLGDVSSLYIVLWSNQLDKGGKQV